MSDFNYHNYEDMEPAEYRTVEEPGNDRSVKEPEKEPEKKTETPKRKKRSPFLTAFLCAIIIGVIGGGMILGSFAIGNKTMGDSQSSSKASITTTEETLNNSESTQTNSPTGDSGYSVADIAKNCTSCVVAITNKGVTETRTMFGTYSQETQSAGSGVVIGKSDTELMIVTNYHVIEGSNELTACFNDSEDSVFKASIKGTDEENDLAVIAIKLSDISDDVLKTISVATIGDSDSLAIGEQVVAIGNALGSGQSVTTGVISAKDREVVLDESGTSTKLLQTDAAINPGNSGGALFNMEGKLVGINSAKYSDTSVEGMGFAIPMSTAKSIIEELMNETTRSKLTSGYGYLGIYGSDVDSDTAQKYGIPSGVYLSEVVKDGAAEAAGLQKGDIICKLDNKKISSMSALKERLQYYAAGETVKVTFQRSNDGSYEEQTVDVVLGDSSDAENDTTQQNENSQNNQSGNNNNQGQQGGNSFGYDQDESDSFFNFFQ